MEPPLAAVGSATVAVLSQSSDIQRPFLPGGGVTWSTIIAPFTCCCTNNSAVADYCSKRVVNARSVF